MKRPLKVHWTEPAQLDLREAQDYIATESPLAAAHLDERLERAVRRLIDFPLTGRPGRVSGTREMVLTGTAYLLIYTVSDAGLTIYRVMHGARQWPPG